MQMCQFHMLQIVRRYLTGNPKMKASIDLMLIMREMKHLTKEVFEAEYAAWKERYTEFLNKRVTHKDGKSCYLHRKVRMVVHSIDFFTCLTCSLFQCPECAGMPNTNNKIEGTFYRLEEVVEQSYRNVYAEQEAIYKRLFPATVELIFLSFLPSTNGVFRLLRGSPSRILRNPQQGDF